MPPRFLKLLASLLLAGLLLQSAEGSSAPSVFKNPLLHFGPDPWVYFYKGEYFYIRSARNRLTLMRTTDITALSSAATKVIWTPKENSNAHHLWAPEIHRIDGKWYVYYAADDGANENHQIYVLENPSDDPFQGEFTMKGHLRTDPTDLWAIDASVFEHRGRWYLIWAGWEKRSLDPQTQCIYIARLKNPWTLDSERVLLSRPEYPWERIFINKDGSRTPWDLFVNEGPQALTSPDGRLVHLVYSASSCWTPDYALGLLTAKADANLLDPKSWSKASSPVFKQSPKNGVYGPGHNCFFKSPDGTEDYILYHARDTETDPKGKDVRNPRAQPFHWDKDGYPVFGSPLPTSAVLKKPSGTPATAR